MGKWKANYCWVVCIALLLLQSLTIGFGSNSFSVYAPFILDQYGFTNSQGSFITTMRWLFSFLSLFFVDKFYGKLDLRKGIAIAAMCSTLAYFAYSAARTFAGFCVAGALSGIGHGLGTVIPVSLLVSRWFKSRRTFAIGVATAGSTMIDVIIPPIITTCIQRFGIELSFLMEAGLMLLITVIIFLLVRNRPEDIGAQPYYSEKAEAKRAKAIHIDMNRRDWVLMLIAMIFLGAVSGPGVTHSTILYTTQGYESMAIAFALSSRGMVLLGSKFVYGLITDRLGTIKSNRIFGGVWLVGQTLCCLAWLQSNAVMFIGLLGVGMGLSLSTVGIAAWAADLSTEQEHARTLKRFKIAVSLGSVVFSIVPGMMADALGSYIPPYIMFAVMAVLTMAAVQYVYRVKRPQQGVELK